MNANGKKKEYSSSVSDWLNDDLSTEYSATMYKRRHAPMRQSSSVGHLVTLGRMSNHAQSEKDVPYDKKIKRTKSLWKFKKIDDVLEGMSLWKHRSLVDINSSEDAAGCNRGTPMMDKRMAVTREISVDSGDENSTIMNGTQGKSKSSKIFENGIRNSGVIESDESDQESCIVVDDHRKSDTINTNKLPRTRLTKANSASSMKIDNGYKEYKDESDMIFESNKLQTFKYNRIADSAWYDSWGERRKK